MGVNYAMLIPVALIGVAIIVVIVVVVVGGGSKNE